MFFRYSREGKITILLVYIDDTILIGNNVEEVQKLKEYLGKEFEIKDLRSLKYLLGLEVARSKKGITVTQRKYTLDLLKEVGMLGCKPRDVPIEANYKMGVFNKDNLVDRARYQQLIGRLISLYRTRPDIAFSVLSVNICTHLQKSTWRPFTIF